MAPDRLSALLVAGTLGAARVTPVIWLVAPLGGQRLPASVRVGFAVLLAALASPPLRAATGAAAPARRAALVVAAASARLIASGLALAAPVVVAIWLTDLALGLVARAAPQVPVYFLGLPLKGLLAIGIILLGLGALASALAGDM